VALAEHLSATGDAFTIVEGAGGDAFEINFHRIEVGADGFAVGKVLFVFLFKNHISTIDLLAVRDAYGFAFGKAT
jgi:hypothetical protein